MMKKITQLSLLVSFSFLMGIHGANAEGYCHIKEHAKKGICIFQVGPEHDPSNVYPTQIKQKHPGQGCKTENLTRPENMNKAERWINLYCPVENHLPE